jgi:hypothetical protein
MFKVAASGIEPASPPRTEGSEEEYVAIAR